MDLTATRPQRQQIEYVFNEKLFTNIFFKLRDVNSRFVINYGGSDSSKSHSQAQHEIIRCLERARTTLVIRKFGTTLKDSCIPLINNYISKFELSKDFIFNKSDRILTNKINGSQILFRGIDDSEKIKSIEGVSRIWVEEANELDRDDFLELNRRIRGEADLQITLTFNPIIETHWIKHHFFDNEIEDCTIIKSTYKDNRFALEKDIEQLEKLKDIDISQYMVYALGEWGSITTGMEFYSCFKYQKHVKNVEVLKNVPIHISFDQNVVPYCTATLYQIVKKENKYELRQFDEVCLSNPKNKTEEVCREIIIRWEDYLQSGVYYYGDASGKKRDTRGMENDYDIVERVLRPYLNNTSRRVPYSNPHITKRRDFINRLLGSYYNIEFVIDRNCKNSIADFQMVKEDVDKTKLKQKKKDKSGVSFEQYGHCFIGETLITTIHGDKRIDEIKIGDLVLTRNGYKPVINIFDNGIKKVVPYYIGKNKLVCTSNHRVYLNDNFVEIKEVNNQFLFNNFYTFTKNKICKKKLFIIGELSLQDTLNQIKEAKEYILTEGQTEEKSDFMFINILKKMEKYLLDLLYIIKTATLLIMKYVIWNVLKRVNTQANMVKMLLMNLKNLGKMFLLQRHKRQRKNGMGLILENLGTKNTPKILLIAKDIKQNVLNVIANLTDMIPSEIKLNFVVEGAKTDIICERTDYLGNGMKRESVRSAEGNFQSINGLKKKPVQQNAHVYDIEILDEHEYFANGILVHNCSDSFDYVVCEAFRSYFERPIITYKNN